MKTVNTFKLILLAICLIGLACTSCAPQQKNGVKYGKCHTYKNRK